MPSSPISPCPSCPPHAAGGHRCAVYSSSVTDAESATPRKVAVACAGRHGRPRQRPRSLPACDRRHHPVHRARSVSRAATAVEVPRRPDGVHGLRPLGPRRAWRPILDALRDRLRVRAGQGRDRCPTAAIIDSATYRRRHRAPIQPRLRWRQENDGVKRHLAVDVNGLLLTSSSPPPRSPTATPHTDSWPHGASSFSTIGLLAADGVTPEPVAHLGEDSHPYSADHHTPPRRRWFPRPARVR